MSEFGMDDVKQGDLVFCIGTGLYMIKYKIYKILGCGDGCIQVTTEHDGHRWFSGDRFISVKWLISEE